MGHSLNSLSHYRWHQVTYDGCRVGTHSRRATRTSPQSKAELKAESCRLITISITAVGFL